MDNRPNGPPLSPIRVFAITGENTKGQSQRAEQAFAREGYPDVKVAARRTFRIQGQDDLEGLKRLLANQAAGETLVELPSRGDGIEVAYQPSVFDPETDTGLSVAKRLGINVEWLRLAWLYEVIGVDRDTAEQVIRKALCNDVIQTIVKDEIYTQSLYPTGAPEPMRRYDLSHLSVEELCALSESSKWYAPTSKLIAVQKQQSVIGRPWTDAEIEMIFQSWGDHCYHTTWKGLGLLKKLMATTRRINHPLCRSIFVDNAGAMVFYDGYVILIKGETHNHPSSIAPLGGIQTKHGGVLRDMIFMMLGGYPIGSSTIMGTRLPSKKTPLGALPARTIVAESIEGTASYCNPMGVPMMYAAYREDDGYPKCLALGVSTGVTLESAEKREPKKGQKVLAIGGKTGRDGVHGATASGANLTAEMVEKEGATVQIGHPIVERQFTTLMPILIEEDLIEYSTDLGAGGFSCAVGESVGKCGADIDLTNLPVKVLGLSSWEKWVSESQERGLLIVKPEKLDRVLELCRLYDVEAFVLGTCRDDGRLVVVDGNDTIVDMDLEFLWNGCPIDTLTTTDPKIVRSRVYPRELTYSKWPMVARQILSDYACCDQSEATNQFDSTVQGRTVVGPLINGVPSDVFVSKVLRGKPYGAVSSYSFNPRWNVVDPVGSVRNLLALAISRTIAAGVNPDDMVLCGNWYTPTRTPEQRWYLKEMVGELCRITEKIGIPVVSGKDSSSGTFTDSAGNKIDVPMTFVPSTLGRMPNVKEVRTKVFRSAGSSIYLIRPQAKTSMAGSVMHTLIQGENTPASLPWIDNEKDLRALWWRIAWNRQRFESISAIGEGGLFLQAFHGCLGSGLGADLSFSQSSAVWDCFGECPGSFLVSLEDNQFDSLEELFDQFDCQLVGSVVERPGLLVRVADLEVINPENWVQMVNAWRGTFQKEVLG